MPLGTVLNYLRRRCVPSFRNFSFMKEYLFNGMTQCAVSTAQCTVSFAGKINEQEANHFTAPFPDCFSKMHVDFVLRYHKMNPMRHPWEAVGELHVSCLVFPPVVPFEHQRGNARVWETNVDKHPHDVGSSREERRG